MKNYTVSFKVSAEHLDFRTTEMIEFEIKDLIETAVLPTLGLSLVPVTFEVKKARN